MNIEARRRRAKFCFYAAILCIPLILFLCVAAIGPAVVARSDDARTGWKDVGYGALVILVTLMVGVGYALAKRYALDKSPALPAKVGAITGIVGGLVPANMFAYVLDDPAFIPIFLVPFALVGGALPWWLVRRGQRALWEPIDDELIESGEEVVVRARGIRGLTLSVSGYHVSLKRSGSNDFYLFEELAKAESVTVRKLLNEERHDVTGGGDELAISPGPALRIRLIRDEWFVPLDNADDVARLINHRRAEAVALGDEPDADLDEDEELEELEWHARRNRLFSLSVDDSSVGMSCNQKGTWFYAGKDLDEVESVTVTRINAEQHRDVTGDEDEVLVTAGEALLIRVDDGEWLFPIDKAEEIATAINDRIARYKRKLEAIEDEEFDTA